jgi:hypothetical protein
MIYLPPTIPKRTRSELSAFVLNSFESAGIRVAPSSRLARMNKIFAASGFIASNHPDFEIAIEAERDLQLLGFAFDQFAEYERTTPFVELLKKIVSDSPLPQHDREHSPGRDAAFELYVGAVCQSAQLLPINFEEPDVTFLWQGTKYAIPAKRIKNEKKIVRRIREATDQIRKCGLPGIVAIETCLALNPNNLRIRHMPDTVFWSEYFENLKISWSQHQKKVQEIITRENVLGIIVHDYQIREQPNSQISLAGMTMRVPALHRTSAEQRSFETLSTLYTYALPNQDDISNLPLVL